VRHEAAELQNLSSSLRHAEFPKLLVMHRFPLHKHSHKNDTKNMNKSDCHKVQGSLIHSSKISDVLLSDSMILEH
jgi:hypothetical protein